MSKKTAKICYADGKTRFSKIRGLDYYGIKVGLKKRESRWCKPHDPTVISFDLVPACDTRPDGHAAYSY